MSNFAVFGVLGKPLALKFYRICDGDFFVDVGFRSEFHSVPSVMQRECLSFKHLKSISTSIHNIDLSNDSNSPSPFRVYLLNQI